MRGLSPLCPMTREGATRDDAESSLASPETGPDDDCWLAVGEAGQTRPALPCLPVHAFPFPFAGPLECNAPRVRGRGT